MKFRPFVKVISLALVISQAAYALHTGKPIKVINALIQEPIDSNDEIIEKNSDAILLLADELSVLDGRVGLLDTGVINLVTDFDLLKGFVTQNTNDITLALVKRVAVQVQLTTLEGEVALNTKAIDEVDLAIIVTHGKIDGLTKAIAILNNTIVINTAAITEIEGKILSAERKKPYKDIDDLNASLNSYETRVETNFKKMVKNEAEIAIAQRNLESLTTKYYALVALADKKADASEAAISELKFELSILMDANVASVDVADKQLYL